MIKKINLTGKEKIEMVRKSYLVDVTIEGLVDHMSEKTANFISNLKKDVFVCIADTICNTNEQDKHFDKLKATIIDTFESTFNTPEKMLFFSLVTRYSNKKNKPGGSIKEMIFDIIDHHYGQAVYDNFKEKRRDDIIAFDKRKNELLDNIDFDIIDRVDIIRLLSYCVDTSEDIISIDGSTSAMTYLVGYETVSTMAEN